jgi:Fic family protein
MQFGLPLRGVSQDTATRDINNLIAKGILVKGAAGGRSTAYVLVVDGLS